MIINWHTAPAWAQWFAADLLCGGRGMGTFTDLPPHICASGVWNFSGRIAYAGEVDLSGTSWKLTLTRRPAAQIEKP